MEFKSISTNHDNCPIILIDCSESTLAGVKIPINYNNDESLYYESFRSIGKFESRDTQIKNLKSEGKKITTIMKYQLNIAKKHFESLGISNVYLMFWNYDVNIYSMEQVPVSVLDSIRVESSGSTMLANPLKSIPRAWKTDKKISELYIFTDGEINDGNLLSKPLKEFAKDKMKIYIITVEDNDNNYLIANFYDGNNIYKANEDSWNYFVKRFYSYNEFHVLEPFISFDKFQGQVFKSYYIYEFAEYIKEQIAECKSNESVLKLAHDLSLTIYHLKQNKSDKKKKEIDQIFTDLFSSANIVSEI